MDIHTGQVQRPIFPQAYPVHDLPHNLRNVQCLVLEFDDPDSSEPESSEPAANREVIEIDSDSEDEGSAEGNLQSLHTNSRLVDTAGSSQEDQRDEILPTTDCVGSSEEEGPSGKNTDVPRESPVIQIDSDSDDGDNNDDNTDDDNDDVIVDAVEESPTRDSAQQTETLTCLTSPTVTSHKDSSTQTSDPETSLDGQRALVAPSSIRPVGHPSRNTSTQIAVTAPSKSNPQNTSSQKDSCIQSSGPATSLHRKRAVVTPSSSRPFRHHSGITSTHRAATAPSTSNPWNTSQKDSYIQSFGLATSLDRQRALVAPSSIRPVGHHLGTASTHGAAIAPSTSNLWNTSSQKDSYIQSFGLATSLDRQRALVAPSSIRPVGHCLGITSTHRAATAPSTSSMQNTSSAHRNGCIQSSGPATILDGRRAVVAPSSTRKVGHGLEMTSTCRSGTAPSTSNPQNTDCGLDMGCWDVSDASDEEPVMVHHDSDDDDTEACVITGVDSSRELHPLPQIPPAVSRRRYPTKTPSHVANTRPVKKPRRRILKEPFNCFGLNPCHICGRYNRRPSDLRRHIRVHTGQRPFRCSFCGMTFKCTSSLYGHMRRRHAWDGEAKKKHFLIEKE